MFLWLIAVIFRDVAGRDGWRDPVTRGFFVSELFAAYFTGFFYKFLYHSCLHVNGDPFSSGIGNTCVDRFETAVHVFFLVLANEVFILLCGWFNLTVFMKYDGNVAFRRAFSKNVKFSLVKAAAFTTSSLFLNVVGSRIKEQR
jgi:hypothetical protein